MGTVAGHEKRVLQTAVAALKENQVVIVEGFALELTNAIAQDTKRGSSKEANGGPQSFSSLRFDQLELMGDEQVQETLDGARLQQCLLLAADTGLAEFSARLSTAQGFTTVQADKNPLRPEVFSQALLKLLRRLPVGNEVRSRWLTHGAQLLGKELLALYVVLNDLLEQQGVALAPYGVVSAQDDKPRRPASVDAGRGPLAQEPYHGTERVGTYPVSDGLAAPQGYDAVWGNVGQDFPAPFRAGSPAPNDRRELSSPEGAARVSREQLLTLDHLHRLMVGDYDDVFEKASVAEQSPTVAALQHDFAHTLPAALDVLAALEGHGLAGPKAKNPRVAPPLPIALLREQLKAEAKTLGQALGIEVVGLMIEQLTNDERLLAPVRQLISEAEPAFLRLGLTDPRFFSDKKHPARLLLETITAKSLAYPDEDAPGFENFMRDLKELSAVLKDGNLSDAQDFATLLADFEEKQSRKTAEANEAQNVAVQALLRAEKRNLLAEKIAQEIRVRPDFVSGNRAITSFLTGPWAHVMANERLLGEHAGIRSSKAVYSLTLGDLLWSLNVVQASRHRKRLVKLIPGMLNSVREGLLSIDFPLEQSKAFYDALMVSHEASIKLVADKPEAGLDSYAALEKAFEAGDENSDRTSEPWLAPTEAQESGFMEDWDASKPDFEPTVPRQQDPISDAPAGRAGVASESAAELPSRRNVELLMGAWVELLAEDRWLRAQLTWISPHNTLFMFTSDGGRSHSMTLRMLQQLLSAGRVRVISDQGLLEGALDGVTRTAMRNSVDFGSDA